MKNSILKELFVSEEDLENDDTAELLEVVGTDGDLVDLTHRLLLKITTAVKSSYEVWDIYANFMHTLGRFRSELDCRLKQVRMLSFYLQYGWLVGWLFPFIRSAVVDNIVHAALFSIAPSQSSQDGRRSPRRSTAWWRPPHCC